MILNMSPGLLHTIDISAVLVLSSALIGIFPAMTTVVTFIWVCLRVYEMDTIQCLLHKRKCKKD